MHITIRLEKEHEYRQVENITREAFWNQFVPGADEHFILHRLRNSHDFIKELDFVLLVNGTLAGSIVYSKATIKNDFGISHEIILMGPVCIHPTWQNKGLGAMLIKHSLKRAASLGYKAVALYGYPEYYERFGFANGKRFGISAQDGKFMKALQVLELFPGALKAMTGRLHESFAFQYNPQELIAFDSMFAAKQKEKTASQEKFSAMLTMQEE